MAHEFSRSISDDPHDLTRFIEAQDSVYSSVMGELQRGRKQSHWMWFIFPQVYGLGRSAMAARYAIRSSGEAIAYLGHPRLGARLSQCTETALAVSDKTARDLFGSPDDMKFHSSMTLFGEVSKHAIFQQAIDRFFRGGPDGATLAVLARWCR